MKQKIIEWILTLIPFLGICLILGLITKYETRTWQNALSIGMTVFLLLFLKDYSAYKARKKSGRV